MFISTIPPYFKLDRGVKTVPDVNQAFPILTLDSLKTVKRNFSRLFQRNNQGNIYCILILAQNISFSDFMDKARSSLMNLDYGIFPRACDHERTAEIGWLLYSTRQQDEERLSELLSSLVQETIGAKWRPIRSNDRNRKDNSDITD
jgi:hypothetical protein